MITKESNELGKTLKDISTGLTGVALARVDFLSGTVQYMIQPPLKKGDGAAPEMVGLDIQLLEVVDAGISKRLVKALPESNGIALGSEVTDKVTGLVGIATNKCTYFNGCVCYGIGAKIKKDGDVPEVIYLDWKRLKVTGKGVSADKAIQPPPTVTRPPGGPNTRGRSIRMR